MKKTVFALVMVLLLSVAVPVYGEWDVFTLTLEGLYQLRDDVNAQITARIRESYVPPEGKTIAELFPDPWLAKEIRDMVGAFSTKDVVSQEKLDKIKRLWISGQTVEHVQLTTLEGIQYLRNLESLSVIDLAGITEIPDWIGTLSNLTYLDFDYCPISKVPDSICNLVKLRSLQLSGTNISALPENIGNLSNLRKLSISNTNITVLPESIYSLKLDEFNRSGLDLD